MILALLPSQTPPVNTDYTKAVMNSLTTPGNNVPYAINEFPIRATPLCGAFGADPVYNNGTQVVAFAIKQTQTINNVPCTIVSTYVSMLGYRTTTCTGSPLRISTFLSSSTTTVVATGATPTGVVNVAAGSNVQTGIWYTLSSYVTGLPATTPYITTNYYASQAGCTSSQSSALVRMNYQFPAFGCVSFLAFTALIAASHWWFPGWLLLQVQCLYPVRGPQPGHHI